MTSGGAVFSRRLMLNLRNDTKEGNNAESSVNSHRETVQLVVERPIIQYYQLAPRHYIKRQLVTSITFRNFMCIRKYMCIGSICYRIYMRIGSISVQDLYVYRINMRIGSICVQDLYVYRINMCIGSICVQDLYVKRGIPYRTKSSYIASKKILEEEEFIKDLNQVSLF